MCTARPPISIGACALAARAGTAVKLPAGLLPLPPARALAGAPALSTGDRARDSRGAHDPLHARGRAAAPSSLAQKRAPAAPPPRALAAPGQDPVAGWSRGLGCIC